MELDEFLRSSRTLESFGICGDSQFVDCGPAGIDVLVLRSRRRNRC